jgi:hypothetical protein
LVYLQTQCFHPHLSHDECRCIRHQARHYIIVDDTLYHRGVDLILCHFLIHEEDERVLNDFHAGACGGHLSGLATAQKYLHVHWIFLAHDLQRLYECGPKMSFLSNIHCKMCAHPTPTSSCGDRRPFSKWGIDFMTCNPT